MAITLISINAAAITQQQWDETKGSEKGHRMLSWMPHLTVWSWLTSPSECFSCKLTVIPEGREAVLRET